MKVAADKTRITMMMVLIMTMMMIKMLSMMRMRRMMLEMPLQAEHPVDITKALPAALPLHH